MLIRIVGIQLIAPRRVTSSAAKRQEDKNDDVNMNNLESSKGRKFFASRRIRSGGMRTPIHRISLDSVKNVPLQPVEENRSDAIVRVFHDLIRQI